eukprot:1443186-Amphidinium_carterae.1
MSTKCQGRRRTKTTHRSAAWAECQSPFEGVRGGHAIALTKLLSQGQTPSQGDPRPRTQSLRIETNPLSWRGRSLVLRSPVVKRKLLPRDSTHLLAQCPYVQRKVIFRETSGAW